MTIARARRGSIAQTFLQLEVILDLNTRKEISNMAETEGD